MSSMYVPGDYNCCLSEYAVDGNITTWAYPDMVCAHSSKTNIQQEWWAVDLQNVYVIKEIEIYGRTDCCGDNLSNFDVDVIMPTCPCNGWNDLTDGDVSHCHYQTSAVSPRIRITCPSNTRGRFVRIKRRDMLTLVICEVKVNRDPFSSTRQSGLLSSVAVYARGHIGNGYVGPVIETFVSQSKIQCTSVCITKSDCYAAEYGRNTTSCTMKGKCTNGTQTSLFQDNSTDVFCVL
ncbi:fucolectin-like [Mytilus trossulus]|uniref:fucolectin-like n=1 Tax=Mytilus trossulus TaxID=6551 RepID=UPI00300541FE